MPRQCERPLLHVARAKADRQLPASLRPLLSVSPPGFIRQSRHPSRRFSGLRWLEPGHPTTSPCAALTPADSPYLSRSSNEAERGALAAYLRLLELGGGNGPVESGA